MQNDSNKLTTIHLKSTIVNLKYSTLLRYNGLVPETKPFRLTESVKAAG